MRNLVRVIHLTAFACALVSAPALGQTPPATTKPTATTKPKAKEAEFVVKGGMTVEVKWGGMWRKAVVKNRVATGWALVNYSPGSSHEWVEIWRIRAIGSIVDIPHARPNESSFKPTPPPREKAPPMSDVNAPVGPDRGRGRAATGRVPAAVKEPPKISEPQADGTFAVGDHVDVLTHSRWATATVVKRQGGWHLVKDDTFKRLQWVEPWRVAKIGDEHEKLPTIWPHAAVSREDELPPTKLPAPKPAAEVTSSIAEDRTATASKLELESDPAYRKADWSAATKIDSGNAPVEQYTVVPVAKTFEIPNGVKLQVRPDEFNIVAPVPPNESGDTPVAAFGFFNSKVTGIEVLETGGKSRGTWKFPAGTSIDDISADGQLIATLPKAKGQKIAQHVEVWSLAKATAPVRTLLLFPSEKEKYEYADGVSLVRFVGKDRLVTATARGFLAGWDITTGKVVWKCDTGRFNGKFVVDRARRYVAFVDGWNAVVLNATSGVVVSRVRVSGGPGPIEFTPSGAGLMVASSMSQGPNQSSGYRKLVQCDLAAAKIVSDIAVPLLFNAFLPLDDRTAALDGIMLLDTQTPEVFWRMEVENGATAEVMQSGLAYCIVREASGAMSAKTLSVLPPASAYVGDKSKLVLASGGKATVQFELGGADEAVRQTVIAGITKQMADRGVTIEDGQPVRVVVSSAVGPAVPVKFRKMGDFTEQSVSVNTQINTVTVFVDNQPIWVIDHSFSATSFSGKTIEEAIASGVRASIESLATAQLPQYLIRPYKPMERGSSQLTKLGELLIK